MTTNIHGHQTDTNGHADGHGGHRADTVRALSALHGQQADTAMRRVRRRLGKGYGLDTPLTLEQIAELFGALPVAEPVEVAVPVPDPVEALEAKVEEEQPEPTSTSPWRRPILYGLMVIPAAASVQNLYHVTYDLTGEISSAALLTGLFSASPFAFVLAGLRSNWTKALTGSLIGYEFFANSMRIYGGLMGAGKVAQVFYSGLKYACIKGAVQATPYEKPVATMTGNPTRFLGLITDVFPAGTHQTAIAMAVIMSALAAGVFYAAYNELGKK